MTSLHPVLEEMAASKCFTLDKDTDGKESRLWLDDLDHAQLLRYNDNAWNLVGLVIKPHSLTATSVNSALPYPLTIC